MDRTSRNVFAAVFVPEFPLQALLRGQSQALPAVVVDDEVALKRSQQRGVAGKAPVIAMNAQAVLTGVQLGMTAPQAQARCTGVRVLTRDRVEESAVYASLLHHIGEQCADVEATGLGLVTMDLFGCRAWHHHWKVAGDALCRSLGRALRLDLVMGIGHTPDQARLAAVSIADAGPVVRVLERDASQTLRDEPIDLLHPSAALSEVMRLWGIATVGQFLDLPREEASHRLGAEAASLCDLVTGKRHRLLRLVRPPVSYEQVSHFDYEVETLEPLLFLLRRGLETLTTRLASQYRVTSQIQVVLPFADGTEVKEVFRVPDPSNDVDLLFRIVQCRLESLVAKSPVTGLSLALTPEKPKKRQYDFFQAVLHDPNRFAHTLAELESLIGSDRVGRPRALGTHRPDAFVLEPFDRSMEMAEQQSPGAVGEIGVDVETETETGSSSEPVALGLPLRRCRPPLQVRVATERHPGALTPKRLLDGPYPGSITAIRGPWKTSGDWWDPGAWMREEWDVELELDGEAILCQLARIAQAWTLEGVYG